MTKNVESAIAELKAICAPVIERSDESLFVISGEDNIGDVVWADYYREYPMSYLDDFGVHKDIVALLDKHGLYAEWANPGYLNVHKA
jgi:hypothetical protein